MNIQEYNANVKQSREWFADRCRFGPTVGGMFGTTEPGNVVTPIIADGDIVQIFNGSGWNYLQTISDVADCRHWFIRVHSNPRTFRIVRPVRPGSQTFRILNI